MAVEKMHRHLGVYGICFTDNKLLVVHKIRGPYANRYDLPGGTIESNESIIQTIYREYEEETGLSINIDRNVGTAEFIVKYAIREAAYVQHIAIFLEVSIESGSITNHLISDDTCRAEWIELDRAADWNSSPLVIAAKNYITDKKFDGISMRYDDWEVAGSGK